MDLALHRILRVNGDRIWFSSKKGVFGIGTSLWLHDGRAFAFYFGEQCVASCPTVDMDWSF